MAFDHLGRLRFHHHARHGFRAGVSYHDAPALTKLAAAGRDRAADSRDRLERRLLAHSDVPDSLRERLEARDDLGETLSRLAHDAEKFEQRHQAVARKRK